MPKAPGNDTTPEVQNSSLLDTDDKQGLHSASSSSHIEVPVGSLAVQDTFIENQPDEQQSESQRYTTEEVAETERYATVAEQNFVGDDSDNVSEKQLNVTERHEEAGDEMVTNMSVQVRSGGKMSVACGEGADTEHLPDEAQNIKSVKRASPLLQYSSDAAATGL